MSEKKIEIKLKYVDNEYVDLKKMSVKALESFLSVTESLKNIADNISNEVTFSIREGSACASIHAPEPLLENIYNSMNEAISGDSEDDIVVKNLRNIQNELKNDNYSYYFKYADISLDKNIRQAKTITKKKSYNIYENKLAILSGFFNSIGGVNPNYHFDNGLNEKITDCEIADVDELKDFLYKNISCLVLEKSSKTSDKITYSHRSILTTENQKTNFRSFLRTMENSKDVFDRLEAIYDFADNSESRIEDLKILMKSYNDLFTDVNELKTLLILTKSLKDNSDLKKYRERLLSDLKGKLKKV